MIFTPYILLIALGAVVTVLFVFKLIYICFIKIKEYIKKDNTENKHLLS